MLLVSSPTITKQDIRQTALNQLQHCKKQLRALEAYTAKIFKTPQPLWVPQQAIEAQEQCQALHQTIDQLVSFVSNTHLSHSTSPIQRDVNQLFVDNISTINSPS